MTMPRLDCGESTGSDEVCRELLARLDPSDGRVCLGLGQGERTSALLVAKQVLSEMGALPEDWNGQGSRPPNERATGLAFRVLLQADEMALRWCAVLPSAEDGVTISFRRGKKSAAIEIYNSGEAAAVVSSGEGRVEAWEVTPDEAGIGECLGRVAGFLEGARTCRRRP